MFISLDDVIFSCEIGLILFFSGGCLTCALFVSGCCIILQLVGGMCLSFVAHPRSCHCTLTTNFHFLFFNFLNHDPHFGFWESYMENAHYDRSNKVWCKKMLLSIANSLTILVSSHFLKGCSK